MKFLITLNMPSVKNPVHQIVVEHPAKTLAEFMEALNGNSFVVVEHFYSVDKTDGSGGRTLKNMGEMGLNAKLVGKVALYNEAWQRTPA